MQHSVINMFRKIRHKPGPVSYIAGYLPPELFNNLSSPWIWSRPFGGLMAELYSCGSRPLRKYSSCLGGFKFRSPVKLRSLPAILNESCCASIPITGPLSMGCGVNVRFRSSPLQDGSTPFHAPTSCPRKLLSSARFDPP